MPRLTKYEDIEVTALMDDADKEAVAKLQALELDSGTVTLTIQTATPRGNRAPFPYVKLSREVSRRELLAIHAMIVDAANVLRLPPGSDPKLLQGRKTKFTLQKKKPDQKKFKDRGRGIKTHRRPNY